MTTPSENTDDGVALVAAVIGLATVGLVGLLLVAMLAPLLALIVQSASACGPGPVGGPANLDLFLTAIRTHESSGNYTTRNPTSTASGAYQFLDSTWTSEATAAGQTQWAAVRAWQAPPAIQDAVAGFMATNLFDGPAAGDWLQVAGAWYLGHVPAAAELDVVPPGNSITPRQYETAIGALMAAGGGARPAFPSQPCATPVVNGTVGPGYVNPFAVGKWAQAGIDQGTDWIPIGPQPVLAIAPGVVVNSTVSSGWPAGGWISYRVTAGSHAGLTFYVAEHLTALVPDGTVVAAGQQIGVALPGWPFTEWGFADPAVDQVCSTCLYNGRADGTPTPGGQAFARFLMELGAWNANGSNTGSRPPNPGPGPDRP